MSYGVDAPAYWNADFHDQPGCELTQDLCVIQDQYFFIKGIIELPVINSDELFAWTAWVSLSRDNFERAKQVWSDPNRTSEPAYFGWLTTRLPFYPDTINLKTNVHTRALGLVPFIELEPTEHPLAVEQRSGISLDRVQAIAEALLHP